MGNIELVRVLLAARASVHAESRSGTTALAEAVREGYDEVASLLRAAARSGTVEGPEREHR